MDFKTKHKDSPDLLLKDLVKSKDAISLILETEKGFEIDFSFLRKNLSKNLQVDSHLFPFAKIVELIEAAKKAREFSYAPYSHFNVGSAILSADPNKETKIFKGCNIENAAYGSTICAERTAALKAVSEGFRIFHAFAVVGGFDDSKPEELKETVQKDYITPCGPCRQVTNEFEADPCFLIMAKDTGKVFVTILKYFFPGGFGPKNLDIDASSYNRHSKH